MVKYYDTQKIKHIHGSKAVKELSKSYKYKKNIYRDWCCGYIVTV